MAADVYSAAKSSAQLPRARWDLGNLPYLFSKADSAPRQCMKANRFLQLPFRRAVRRTVDNKTSNEPFVNYKEIVFCLFPGMRLAAKLNLET